MLSNQVEKRYFTANGGHVSRPHVLTDMYINHYYTKSAEDWEAKNKRGDAVYASGRPAARRGLPDYIAARFGIVYNTEIVEGVCARLSAMARVSEVEERLRSVRLAGLLLTDAPVVVTPDVVDINISGTAMSGRSENSRAMRKAGNRDTDLKANVDGSPLCRMDEAEIVSRMAALQATETGRGAVPLDRWTPAFVSAGVAHDAATASS